MNKKIKILSTILSLSIIGTTLISAAFCSKANDLNLNDNQNTNTESLVNNTLITDENTSSAFSMNDLKNKLKTTRLVELKSVDSLREYINEYNSSNAIPTSYDNSTSEYFPPIGDQGELGSCNSWAAVYYQMTFSVNKALDRPGNISANIMSPSFSFLLEGIP